MAEAEWAKQGGIKQPCTARQAPFLSFEPQCHETRAHAMFVCVPSRMHTPVHLTCSMHMIKEFLIEGIIYTSLRGFSGQVCSQIGTTRATTSMRFGLDRLMARHRRGTPFDTSGTLSAPFHLYLSFPSVHPFSSNNMAGVQAVV